MADNLDLIPPQRREAARTALALFTDGHDVGPIALLKGGVSGALIYRVDGGQRSFALRLEPERIALEHRRRGFACMGAAAAIGVAPCVYIADPIAGIAVMDLVDAKPIVTHPGGRVGVARELGALIGRIQTTQPFPTMLGDGEDMIASALQSLARRGCLRQGYWTGTATNWPASARRCHGIRRPWYEQEGFVSGFFPDIDELGLRISESGQFAQGGGDLLPSAQGVITRSG